MDDKTHKAICTRKQTFFECEQLYRESKDSVRDKPVTIKQNKRVVSVWNELTQTRHFNWQISSYAK
jgi:hypothetical protein